MNKPFKVGDKVCDILRGNGEVVDILENIHYSIKVKLEGKIGCENYTPDGRFHEQHKLPSLYHGHDLIVEVKEPVYEYQVIYQNSKGLFRISDQYYNDINVWKDKVEGLLYSNVSFFEPSKRLVEEKWNEI